MQSAKNITKLSGASMAEPPGSGKLASQVQLHLPTPQQQLTVPSRHHTLTVLTILEVLPVFERACGAAKSSADVRSSTVRVEHNGADGAGGSDIYTLGMACQWWRETFSASHKHLLPWIDKAVLAHARCFHGQRMSSFSDHVLDLRRQMFGQVLCDSYLQWD